jgi:murein DD-endopeptidase MepM/ murein hydrolase activator NlpD
MRLLSLLFVPLVVLVSVAVSAEKDPAARFQVVVQRMVDAINRKDYARARQDFNEDVRKNLPAEKTEALFKSMTMQCGRIEKLDPPQLAAEDRAVVVAHFERATLDIRVVLDKDDKIAGLWFATHTPPIPAPEKHVTVLRLPFEGRWKVMAGGDTEELNHHNGCPGQQFAFDFVGVDKDGKTHEGAGDENEDYVGFGRKVLAPADGVVTDVIQGVRDNAPRSMNPISALGNAVVIRHREHEFSVLAHFMNGTIHVKVGDRVARGDVLGLCGNSGNSSGPHVHYHLQNTPIFQDATGIKCFFDEVDVIRDGKPHRETHHSPVRDDILETPSSAAK